MTKYLLTLFFALGLYAQEPAQFIGAGMGLTGIGNFKGFGYFSFSQEVANKTYVTAISEYVRLSNNTLSICPRGGMSKIAWVHAPFTFGLVGDVGACESTVGSISGLAISGRGFVTYDIRKSNYYLVLSGETLKTSGGNITPLITLGIHYGVPK